MLGDPISEQEVKCAIDQMPGDKAPGPDGFTGLFFKKSWEIIKTNVMNVVQQFENLHVAKFHLLNSANVTLLPKKEGPEDIFDFRPISLIHAIAKIIAKVLTLRLGPIMNDLVSNAQSAFIKKRSIHDNFLYVKNHAKRLHKSKTAALLFKLDIRKAFDSIRWEYIVDLLQRSGFLSRFRNWVTALLTTSSPRALLYGVAGSPIVHGRGLHQETLSHRSYSFLPLTRSTKSLIVLLGMASFIIFGGGAPSLGLLSMQMCNIPGLEAIKGENTKVCIAFMHRKSGEFSRFK
jgi:hypothetical protein